MDAKYEYIDFYESEIIFDSITAVLSSGVFLCIYE